MPAPAMYINPTRSFICAVACCMVASTLAFPQATPDEESGGRIQAQLFDPGYLQGDSNYHSITVASDGLIYFSINTHHPHSSARLYKFNPADETIELVGDITQVLGEDVNQQVRHGKIHTPLVEHDGYLYCASQ